MRRQKSKNTEQIAIAMDTIQPGESELEKHPLFCLCRVFSSEHTILPTARNPRLNEEQKKQYDHEVKTF